MRGKPMNEFLPRFYFVIVVCHQLEKASALPIPKSAAATVNCESFTKLIGDLRDNWESPIGYLIKRGYIPKDSPFTEDGKVDPTAMKTSCAVKADTDAPLSCGSKKNVNSVADVQSYRALHQDRENMPETCAASPIEADTTKNENTVNSANYSPDKSVVPKICRIVEKIREKVRLSDQAKQKAQMNMMRNPALTASLVQDTKLLMKRTKDTVPEADVSKELTSGSTLPMNDEHKPHASGNLKNYLPIPVPQLNHFMKDNMFDRKTNKEPDKNLYNFEDLIVPDYSKDNDVLKSLKSFNFQQFPTFLQDTDYIKNMPNSLLNYNVLKDNKKKSQNAPANSKDLYRNLKVGNLITELAKSKHQYPISIATEAERIADEVLKKFSPPTTLPVVRNRVPLQPFQGNEEKEPRPSSGAHFTQTSKFSGQMHKGGDRPSGLKDGKESKMQSSYNFSEKGSVATLKDTKKTEKAEGAPKESNSLFNKLKDKILELFTIQKKSPDPKSTYDFQFESNTKLKNLKETISKYNKKSFYDACMPDNNEAFEEVNIKEDSNSNMVPNKNQL